MKTSRAAPRIPRSVIKSRHRPNPRRAAQHRTFVRLLPCIACGARAPSQHAHVRSSGDGGTGIKPHDKFSLPLCGNCHLHQHRIGEAAFYAPLGIDPVDTALALWTVSGDHDAGLRIIFRARQTIELNAREPSGTHTHRDPPG